jgi:hypothetical protein
VRTREEAVSQFVYHPATPTSAVQHSKVRDLFVAAVHTLWDLVPDGPEKTLALRKLQEAAMYANLAVALQAPADVSETRSVARVLPVYEARGASDCDAGVCDCIDDPTGVDCQ